MLHENIKTMTITEKLSKLKEVARPGSVAKRLATDAINGAKTLRPVYYQGSGKWTSVANHAYETKRLLDALEIRYFEGNDATRGGQTGYYIQILH